MLSFAERLRLLILTSASKRSPFSRQMRRGMGGHRTLAPRVFRLVAAAACAARTRQFKLAWVMRICRWASVTAQSCELVRFDMAAMENPDIEGMEYQQGTLPGYELREYLLEKWGRKCAYCDCSGVAL